MGLLAKGRRKGQFRCTGTGTGSRPEMIHISFLSWRFNAADYTHIRSWLEEKASPRKNAGCHVISE